MSRHKHKLRFIGIFLSVILSVSSVPLYAFASGTYDTGGAAAEEVTVSCEYVAKRGEFEKHYLLSDGSFVAVSYPEAIHYRNADGEWEDIDSNLHAEASSSRIVTGDCGTFAASFSTGRRAGRLVSLSNREFSLSWSLSGDGERMVSSSPVLAASSSSVMQARAKISDSITGKPVSDSETFALRGASGSVGYSALFADAPEISAEYTVYRNKIEEDIYINSPTDLRSLRMEFDTAGLTAEVRDDGSVEFLDENGEMRFRIGIPYMEDAANEILTDIHVNAEQNGDSCTVTYTPDEEWLSSSERSYPILFDPSVTTDEYNSNIVDTYVAEGDTANHSGEQKLFYGVKSGKVHRVYIKINNLPALDPSMPVYGATMSLTYLDGTKTGKAVEIRRVNASWSPETITYANQPGYSAVLGSMAFDASKPVTFNLSSDVASLYDEYNAAENYGYVVKYVDEGKTNADYNGFWSADYTKAAKRPVLTVSYGYSLPSSLTNGSVYSFKNVGSGSFMTVHDGKDANYTNVYQKNTTVSNLTASQKFKLEQVSATGGYLLRAMCSSNGTNRVVDIQRVGTESYVKSGNNAYLYTATAPKTQQWFIVGVGTNQFKIVLRSNMNLALSAYGTANGTSGGNTSTSAGNVFLSTYSDSAYQRWEIVDENGKNAECDSFAGKLQNGVYYLNNSHYRKYLHKNGTDAKVNGASGLISNLAGTIRWKLTQVGNDEYIIQSMADSSKYLYGSSAGYAYLGSNISASGGGISTAYRWEITHPRNDGGFLVKNVMTGRYLFQDGEDSVGLIGNTGNTEFEKEIRNWGIINSESYGNGSKYSFQELSPNDSFNNCKIEIDHCTTPSIDFGGKLLLWSSVTDFELSQYDDTIISIDKKTNKITALKSGYSFVLAKHKVTQIELSFVCITYADSDIKQFRTTRHSTEPLTLCVAEMYNGNRLWYQMADEPDESGEQYSEILLISQELIDSQYKQYELYCSGENTSIFDLPYCVFTSKAKIDEVIEKGQLYKVDENSDEYFGMWVFFSQREKLYRDRLLFLYNAAQYVELIINIANQAFILANNIQQLVNASNQFASAQYISGISAYNSFDDISDSVAVADGITDTMQYSGKRPTWRESEVYVGTNIYKLEDGYRPNDSFKIIDDKFTSVPYGTAGSSRPDFYNWNTHHCIDVKNYNIVTARGRSSLVNNVVNQYSKRVTVFPIDTTYDVVIDIRGQSWTQDMLNEIITAISSKTAGKMGVSFIK